LSQNEHLALRLARLKPSEESEQRGEGLVFLFAKGGVGKFASRSAVHRILPGDILVYMRSSGSKLAAFDHKAEFLFWTFSTVFENLLPLFSQTEVSLLRDVTEAFEAGKLYSASNPIVADCQRLLALVPAQFNLDHRGQLVRIAATILSDEFKEGLAKRTAGAGPEDHMVQVFEKLSASELINLSVGELADRFNCSRRHLNRLFHQHFGASVASLRMEMRLLKAVSLLRDPNIKIIHVAEQCGFNHLGLFNTCFKRRFGTSPGQWRKSTAANPNAAAGGSPAKSKLKLHYPDLSADLSAAENPAADPALSVMAASCAGKITDGKNILEDLKRRDLLLGPEAVASVKSRLEPRRAG
jgi:AraC-like DNA-binding protein